MKEVTKVSKKVQSFILNSVQSVYQSQGVTINDKHLEVIIKQMTTKVLIT
jgi:DNA-directed RNA polymerase subunit beta'